MSLNRDRWVALCERMGCPGAGDHFGELEAAYAEDHRTYHDARHVTECLALFDALEGLCERPGEVEFALWLHDVVYLPRRSDNEEKSAELAASWLRACPVAPACVRRIQDLILVTAHDREPGTRDHEVLGDIDLHILGAPPHRFDEYEAQVRAEYRWVPWPIFGRRRAEVVRAFLARDPLYRTAECRARFEASARVNLRRSLERLTGSADR